MVQQCLHVTSKMDRQKMGAMMESASWSFWHVKEKIDFKKAGIQNSRLSPSSLTIADLQVRGMKTAHFDASGRRR